MKTFLRPAAAIAFALAGMAAPASAATITLDFEGVGNSNEIGDYYLDAYGVSFGAGALALVAGDAGGSGNFANEPTSDTIMFFLNASSAVLNYAAGFTTGVSFFYTSMNYGGNVSVYDGLNATGNVLATLSLAALGPNTNYPSDIFANWAAIGVTFDGVARSIDFGGVANQIGFDNVTFGAATPGETGGETNVPPVPLPAGGLLLLSGLGVAAAAAQRRKHRS